MELGPASWHYRVLSTWLARIIGLRAKLTILSLIQITTSCVRLYRLEGRRDNRIPSLPKSRYHVRTGRCHRATSPSRDSRKPKLWISHLFDLILLTFSILRRVPGTVSSLLLRPFCFMDHQALVRLLTGIPFINQWSLANMCGRVASVPKPFLNTRSYSHHSHQRSFTHTIRTCPMARNVMRVTFGSSFLKASDDSVGYI